MYGSGKEIEKDLFCLDEKVGDLKGMIYWFCSREELTSLYCKTNGFEIYNLEQKDYLIHNLSIKNSQLKDSIKYPNKSIYTIIVE